MSDTSKKVSPLVQNEDTINHLHDTNTYNPDFYENQVDILEFKTYNLKSFMELDLPKPKMLLDPIITEGSLSMLHAYRGIGKSFFAMSLALAVATGGKFLRWKAPKATKVLYVDGEMQAASLQERFARLSASSITGIETAYTENLELLSADMQEETTINIGNGSTQESIEKIIHEKGIEMLILDNISSLTRIDELDSQAWLPIQDWLLDLRKKGVAVFLIHHSGKRGGQRGISKREDILDLVISLQNRNSEKNATASKAKTSKSKTSEKNDDEANDNEEESDAFGGDCLVVFEKNRNIGGKNKLTNFRIKLVEDGEVSIYWLDIYACIKQLREEGLSCRKIEELLGISKSRVSEILKMS